MSKDMGFFVYLGISGNMSGVYQGDSALQPQLPSPSPKQENTQNNSRPPEQKL